MATTTATDPSPDRVLVLTPTGLDSLLIGRRLVDAGLSCQVCADMDGLLAGIRRGAGAAVVAHEALFEQGTRALLETLEAQPPWSDLQVLLLMRATAKGLRHVHLVHELVERANVMLLERPLQVPLFVSAVRSAVRARRRQYQMRDLHRKLERSVDLGDLFVSILGHDLRTPLGAITLSAQTIVRFSQDNRALRPAGRILSSADRMARMIEQILDYARVRRGQGLPVEPRRVDLGALCRRVVQEIEDAAPEAEVVVHEDGTLDGSWDPDRLAQVVSNLVGNAVKHGRHGAHIDLSIDGTDPDVVRLQVRNAGAVAPEALPTLFEPFKETAASTRRNGGSGLGLGLFIAREIARAHGGDITVHSTEADGTTFEVTLPRGVREEPAG